MLGLLAGGVAVKAGQQLAPLGHGHGLRATMVTLALDAACRCGTCRTPPDTRTPRTTRRYGRDRHSLSRHAALRLAELGDC